MNFGGNLKITSLILWIQKKIDILALLFSISLIIFIIEAQLPSLTPIPGVNLAWQI